VLAAVKLIEKLSDGTIYMMNIQSFIGKSNSETDRKRVYREKIEQEKKLLRESNMSQCDQDDGTNDGVILGYCPLETEIKLDKEKKLDIELEKDTIESESVGLLQSFEKETGLTGVLNLAALKRAVKIHGAEYVKKAMNSALERNKSTMVYINGILKNWAKEGYPKDGEDYGSGSTGKNNERFKPKVPKCLTEEQRRLAAERLI
jgi:DnaD/phage-associated family protein